MPDDGLLIPKYVAFYHSNRRKHSCVRRQHIFPYLIQTPMSRIKTYLLKLKNWKSKENFVSLERKRAGWHSGARIFVDSTITDIFLNFLS